MDFFSHLLIALLLSAFFLSDFSLEFGIYAGIMAIMADFDIFLEPLQKKRKSKMLAHKGASHSFFAAFIVSAISGAIFTLITGYSFILSWLIGFLFFSLHVIFDGLAASKIPLFYPFSKKRYRFFIDRAINPILALISGITLLFYLIIYYLSPELYYSNLYLYFLMFYSLYFTYKILSKMWVQLRLPKNHHYIPGILPFRYYIYESHNSGTTLFFSLYKKHQFSSKKYKIIESKIEIDTEDMDFYAEAIKLSQDYMFFSKWESVIPIITKDKNSINVLLFLAESFANGAAYCLEVIFDLISKVPVYTADGFGRILPNLRLA